MDKLLDILTRLEYQVDIEDGAWREWMLSLIHQAMDIAVMGKARKWPEEKPEEEKSYLTRVEINGCVSFQEMYWSEQLCWHKQFGKCVTHWWHLPEVQE